MICGNNEKVREQLEKRFEGDRSVSIIGYTDQMPLYMAAADLVYTKPGRAYFHGNGSGRKTADPYLSDPGL